MEIRWNKSHAMGVEELNRDHRQLFAIAGKLVDRVTPATRRDGCLCCERG